MFAFKTCPARETRHRNGEKLFCKRSRNVIRWRMYFKLSIFLRKKKRTFAVINAVEISVAKLGLHSSIVR